jgi:hypothetical protein
MSSRILDITNSEDPVFVDENSSLILFDDHKYLFSNVDVPDTFDNLIVFQSNRDISRNISGDFSEHLTNGFKFVKLGIILNQLVNQ